MPVYMTVDGVDGEVRSNGGARFATGETLVHIEASAHDMTLDDTAGRESSNVEVMIKILDGRPVHGEPLVVEAGDDWLFT